MKTDELVSMLARAPEPVPKRDARRRLALVLAAAIGASALMMAAALGIRPDLGQAARLSMFWVKIGFPTLLAVAALCVSWRLAHPGMRLRAVPMAMVLPVVAMLLLAAVVLANAAPEERASLIFGATWKTCPFNIAWLSVPLFVATVGFMRSFAPTRPRLAGSACGLLSGSIAAVVYALHCPELAAPFIAIWYFLGMLIPAAAGAVVGSRLLRW